MGPMQMLFLVLAEGFGWAIGEAAPGPSKRWPLWLRLVLIPPPMVIAVIAAAAAAAFVVAAIVAVVLGIVSTVT
jgi:hypothetical protein